jgi:hypothetical protein
MKKFLVYLFAACCLLQPAENAFCSVCSVREESGKWLLIVDGKPFDVKGVGVAWNFGLDGTDYLSLAREIGANTVRTWGIDQGTQQYLDAADSCGLKVDAGIWLPHCNWQKKEKVFSYVRDTDKLEKLEKETIDYVKRFKGHPAVILWNLGNETLCFTNEEEERVAFCIFLEKLAREVKAVDADHPVLYTCHSGEEFSYLKKHVPSLDIIGVNTYGGVDYIHSAWLEEKMNKPYIITEAGPLGPWDRQKDKFGKAIDEADYEKSFHYQYLLEEIRRFSGWCLGGFVFQLGDTTQENLTWWNLTVGPYKRESFYIVKKIYTGHDGESLAPVCTAVELDKDVVRPGEKITAKITARRRGGSELSYDIMVGTCKENVLLHYANEKVPVKVLSRGESTEFLAPEKPDLYKLHALVFDGKGNVATLCITFKVEEQETVKK